MKQGKTLYTPRGKLLAAIEKLLDKKTSAEAIPPDKAIGEAVYQINKKYHLLTPYAEGTQGTFNKFFVKPFIKSPSSKKG